LKLEVEPDRSDEAKTSISPMEETKIIAQIESLEEDKKRMEKEMVGIENRIRHLLSQNDEIEKQITEYDYKTKKVLEARQKKILWEKEKEAQMKELSEELNKRKKELLEKQVERERLGKIKKEQFESSHNKVIDGVKEEKVVKEKLKVKVVEYEKILVENKKLQGIIDLRINKKDSVVFDDKLKRERLEKLETEAKQREKMVTDLDKKLEQLKKIEQEMIIEKKASITQRGQIKTHFEDILSKKLDETEIKEILKKDSGKKPSVPKNKSLSSLLAAEKRSNSSSKNSPTKFKGGNLGNHTEERAKLKNESSDSRNHTLNKSLVQSTNKKSIGSNSKGNVANSGIKPRSVIKPRATEPKNIQNSSSGNKSKAETKKPVQTVSDKKKTPSVIGKVQARPIVGEKTIKEPRISQKETKKEPVKGIEKEKVSVIAKPQRPAPTQKKPNGPPVAVKETPKVAEKQGKEKNALTNKPQANPTKGSNAPIEQLKKIELTDQDKNDGTSNPNIAPFSAVEEPAQINMAATFNSEEEAIRLESDGEIDLQEDDMEETQPQTEVTDAAPSEINGKGPEGEDPVTNSEQTQGTPSVKPEEDAKEVKVSEEAKVESEENPELNQANPEEVPTEATDLKEEEGQREGQEPEDQNRDSPVDDQLEEKEDSLISEIPKAQEISTFDIEDAEGLKTSASENVLTEPETIPEPETAPEHEQSEEQPVEEQVEAEVEEGNAQEPTQEEEVQEEVADEEQGKEEHEESAPEVEQEEAQPEETEEEIQLEETDGNEEQIEPTSEPTEPQAETEAVEEAQAEEEPAEAEPEEGEAIEPEQQPEEEQEQETAEVEGEPEAEAEVELPEDEEIELEDDNVEHVEDQEPEAQAEVAEEEVDKPEETQEEDLVLEEDETPPVNEQEANPEEQSDPANPEETKPL
jgi:hypothetical protein